MGLKAGLHTSLQRSSRRGAPHLPESMVGTHWVRAYLNHHFSHASSLLMIIERYTIRLEVNPKYADA